MQPKDPSEASLRATYATLHSMVYPRSPDAKVKKSSSGWYSFGRTNQKLASYACALQRPAREVDRHLARMARGFVEMARVAPTEPRAKDPTHSMWLSALYVEAALVSRLVGRDASIEIVRSFRVEQAEPERIGQALVSLSSILGLAEGARAEEAAKSKWEARVTSCLRAIQGQHREQFLFDLDVLLKDQAAQRAENRDDRFDILICTTGVGLSLLARDQGLISTSDLSPSPTFPVNRFDGTIADWQSVPIVPDETDEPTPYASAASYCIGQRIMHDRFGIGIVVSTGQDRMTVKFENEERTIRSANYVAT